MAGQIVCFKGQSGVSRPCYVKQLGGYNKLNKKGIVYRLQKAGNKSSKRAVVCTASEVVEGGIIPSYDQTIVSENDLKKWFDAFNLDFELNSSVKVVASGRQVGNIIGAGGQRIQTLQEMYDVRMYVTTAGDFIPGARQRLVQVSGKLGRCMMVLADVISFLVEPFMDEMGEESKEYKRLGVIFPLEVVGQIFGNAGSILKNLTHVTGANVVAQSAESMMSMQDFRKFEIVGTVEQILQAYVGLLALCATETRYSEFSEQLPTVHTDTQWLPRFVATLPRNSALMAARYNVEIGVPESFIPILIGKKSATLIRILQSSGNAQIDIPRDEFIEGTDLRKVIIRGNFKDVIKAQAGLDRLIRDTFRMGILDPTQFGVNYSNFRR
eukprot:TRINITY_DN7750_c1_g2_i2.p1 TRINITY_DN7750_c1_g2~~TRINITY_DN7750_c1_g2_i2.p1  ORF type:complete len:382 (-),score=35.84 TRINITY_DN7750_c1_g2_i2:298-1443(-)